MVAVVCREGGGYQKVDSGGAMVELESKVMDAARICLGEVTEQIVSKI
jgi:hypothetical protein